MVALCKEGHTMEMVGAIAGVSRERIRQRVKHNRISGHSQSSCSAAELIDVDGAHAPPNFVLQTPQQGATRYGGRPDPASRILVSIKAS